MSYRIQNGKMVKQGKTKPKFTAKNPFADVDTSKFKPDAGLATSRDDDCHLWFQTAELVQSIAHSGSMRGYIQGDVNYLELNVIVDIMDEAGQVHMAPQRPDGYFATIAMTEADFRELALQIRKGAMSVRITGRRTGETETSISGERFEPIRFKSAWSAGNTAGYMAYMMPVNGQFIQTDSNKVADFFDSIADDVAARTRDMV